MHTRNFTTGMVLSLLLASLASAGTISTLYLTAGDQARLVAITGVTVQTFDQAPNTHGGLGDEYAIAVLGTIRTLGNGNQGGDVTESYSGAEYQPDGTPTGVNFAYPLSTGGAFYDGATNGVNNFSVDYNTGAVYQFNLDWTNPVLLFAANALDIGITYDPVNQSLWIVPYSGTDVRDYSLAGALLTSFTASAPVYGLAMDYADNTLWADGHGTLYQYSRTGASLSSFGDGLAQNTLGAEFAFLDASPASTPEPGTAMLALGGLLIAAFRKGGWTRSRS